MKCKLCEKEATVIVNGTPYCADHGAIEINKKNSRYKYINKFKTPKK